jgi:hypothetical protein
LSKKLLTVEASRLDEGVDICEVALLFGLVVF